jgi:hypothetical protein
VNAHFDENDGRNLSEYMDAFLAERMRRAQGGTNEDICSRCGHEALWHTPECHMCREELACRRFRS